MSCHQPDQQRTADFSDSNQTPVVLVGNPNVGKSVIFGALTGRYATVSNYPGTTVEVARGTLSLNGHARPVIDTPGIHSIVPLSDDERVTRNILLDNHPATVVQVVDAKNLQRGLLIALELAEAGLPFVLALNMMDEADARGVTVNAELLAVLLGVPVTTSVATRGSGMSELAHSLASARSATCHTTYSAAIEHAIEVITQQMPRISLAPRAVALMLLLGDDELLDQLALTPRQRGAIVTARTAAEAQSGGSLVHAIHRARLARVNTILQRVVTRRQTSPALGEKLGRLAVHPLIGWPVLALVLFVVYLFVGVLGAGVLVDFLESRLFGELLNPWLTQVVTALAPIPLLRDFLVGTYGLVTVALTYSFAIVLPIVGTFFLAFSLLEDSGYLPRLAVMLDRVFRLMGLNGKAVLPMILGLGCDTMATMTTRILDTRKERLQVTLLLALGVPCSAQLGVILGMVGGLGAGATSIWLGVVIAVMLVVGYLSARLIPGAGSDFILELPPLRLPDLRNIVLKTAARMEWYLKEVVPVFVLGTAVLFTLDKSGMLARLQLLLTPLIVDWLGLPAAATDAFLIGFLRRDYGAAGLFALARAGELRPEQVVVSMVVMTLFIPCFANLMMIIKEHGWRAATMVAVVVFTLAFGVGGLLHMALVAFAW